MCNAGITSHSAACREALHFSSGLSDSSKVRAMTIVYFWTRFSDLSSLQNFLKHILGFYYFAAPQHPALFRGRLETHQRPIKIITPFETSAAEAFP
jgi:hypothetical protein